MENSQNLNKTVIQFSLSIAKDPHPAIKAMMTYLQSIKEKDMKTFSLCFGPCDYTGFFANLPGSVKVRDPRKFIEMHQDFFSSPTSAFKYEELSDAAGNEDFLICSVPANVTLPDDRKRRVNIDMMFLKNPSFPFGWMPIRFINTVVDPSQAVLQN